MTCGVNAPARSIGEVAHIVRKFWRAFGWSRDTGEAGAKIHRCLHCLRAPVALSVDDATAAIDAVQCIATAAGVESEISEDLRDARAKLLAGITEATGGDTMMLD